jgi:DNA-binding response OmpR family regulator
MGAEAGFGMEADRPRVLIVGSDTGFANIATGALQAWRMRVVYANNLASARELLEGTKLDLVILDWDGPQDERDRVLATPDLGAPILVISTDSSAEAEISALDSGAAGYMAKPVDPLDFVQRVRGLIMRAQGFPTGPPGEEFPGLELLHSERRLLVGGVDVELTPREFSVLALLFAHRGEVLSVEELSVGAWGHEALGDRNYVEALVSRLRAKLAAAGAGKLILTRRGFGYLVPRGLPELE